MQSSGQARLEAMREVVAALEALAAVDLPDGEKQSRLQALETRLYAATTGFSAGDIPLRSFQALHTALAVAAAYGQPEVAVVIGKQHWPDFEHAVAASERLGTGRYGALRVVQYACGAAK